MPDAAQSRKVRLEWMLPPLLALAAIGFHFAFDVPHHPMLPREDPEPVAKTTTAARTPRPYRARGAAYIQRLRKSWSARPIDEEPIEPRFAEHHEDLLRAILRKAEAAVMPIDEPLLVSMRATCHTIRCELEFCAPAALAEGIVERLPNCTIRGRAFWHELREVEPEQEPDDGEACHRYLVDFAVEAADLRHLKL
jgi:hypothetical protein